MLGYPLSAGRLACLIDPALVLRGATFAFVRTISQRELRNDNAEVMRQVERGEMFTVTRRGVPVARLVPIDEPELRCDRQARKRPTYANASRVHLTRPSGEILSDLRGDR
jgi:prevent-host-death family protein